VTTFLFEVLLYSLVSMMARAHAHDLHGTDITRGTRMCICRCCSIRLITG
jgi:hypothetical protein